MTTHQHELITRAANCDLSDVESRTLRAHLDGCRECASLAADRCHGDVPLARSEPQPPGPRFDLPSARGTGLAWLGAAATAVALLITVAACNAGGSSAFATGTLPAGRISAIATPERSFTPGPSTPSPEFCSPPVLGAIAVCPMTVSVGASLTINPTGCSTPDGRAVLYFGTAEQFGQSTRGTYGETELGSVGVGSGVSQLIVPVPSALGAINGRGGGPVAVGLYAVYSKPDLCRAFVNVK